MDRPGIDQQNERLTGAREQIGPYRLLRVLGEGGMGVVYEAAETGPVRRNVAIKIVRAGLRSNEVKARFDAERQALALMDHPGIATVFQAGETAAGEPYFAMELVRGLPIDEFCDTRKLSTHDRLELIIEVCQAVQHAHQKGVIHRDLKPSNVMVMEQDGKPHPKIIDFGIAKALGLHLTEKTFVTQAGMPLGTAAYMSPEQAESSGMDVDTRTDIYSIGVMLYLLLVGRLPIDPAENGVHAFIYRLASGDSTPPLPSARFDSLGEYRAAVAEARRTNIEHLRRELRGDLDWIVMKALEPDRSRRYETVSALAADIERFINHQTVTARPPTLSYRLRKFIRRNRLAVAFASTGVLILMLSTAFAVAGMVRATRAERKAATEAATAQQVSNFMVDVFKVDRNEPTRPDQITAVELLSRGAKRSELILSQQPVLQAKMMYTIGAAYTELGLYEAATEQFDRALKLRASALGQNDPSVAEAEEAIGRARMLFGDFDTADKHFARALAIRESTAGPSDTATAAVLAGIGALRYRQQRTDEAENFYKRAIAIDQRAPDSSAALARDLGGLGIVYWAQGDFAKAEPIMRQSLSMREKVLGPEHPDLAAHLNNLGGVYWSQKRYDDALVMYERTLRIYERTLDPMHPNMASVLNNIGETYWKLNRLGEAERMLRRALAIKEARLGNSDPSIAVTLNALAGVMRDGKRWKEAEATYQRALAIRQRSFKAGNPSLNETVTDYAAMLEAMGRASEAKALASRYGVKATP
jgi:non-specific serine/threonine protein kinase/serine/threonine-protein kinase